MARIVVDDVRPSAPCGRRPAKAAVGYAVVVSANIFTDGHDVLAARVRWRPTDAEEWQSVPMHELANDRWQGIFRPERNGAHEFVVEAWRDRWATWRHRVEVLAGAGELAEVELAEGAALLAGEVPYRADHADLLEGAAASLRAAGRPREERLGPAWRLDVLEALSEPGPSDHVSAGPLMPLWVDRPRALFGAWYELFPRSEGGLVGSAARLEAVAAMGFDVVYLPPVHPIGTTARKGRNGALVAGPGDPGSPWAIGSPEGGHEALDRELGTLEDFGALVSRAAELGMELALDYALQCSPDHPWISEHPEWFRHRADGTIAYAENPPKRYQDIVPIDFWPAQEKDRAALWSACEAILETWIGRGIRVFRVDNPHTKPLAFWEWLIARVRDRHPEVVFLAEAFTRPRVMEALAEVGFTQSYTYFTWRTSAAELAEYATEVTSGRASDWMRPNFWPNTPDILSGPLRGGPLSSFKARLVLAATISPSYGIYSGYELGENEPASETNEEYAYSEKYERKHRDWAAPWSLAPFVGRVNDIRRRHPALQRLGGLAVETSTNPSVVAFSRVSEDGSDRVLVVVNLDPHNVAEATLGLDLDRLGIGWHERFSALDELTGQRFPWQGSAPYVRLDPGYEPAHILSLERG